MPAKKKSSSRSRSGASSRLTPSRKTATRKTASRRAPARRASKAAGTRTGRTTTTPETESLSLLSTPAATELSGPVVIGADPSSDVAVTQTLTGTEPGLAPEEQAAETYREDLPVGILSLILVASTFLPWYTYKFSGRSKSVSGFATGTWGPMIAFLGLASLLLVILRRARIRVGLPISDTHLHEAVGWISIAGAVVKFRLIPSPPRGIPLTATRSFGVFVAIGAAFLLAFVAGRMSGSTPFVTIPKWHKGRAGMIGLLLLLLTIGGAAFFGATNNINLTAISNEILNTNGTPVPRPSQSFQALTGKFPKCSAGFPIPKNAKPQQAVEKSATQPNCVFTYTHTRTVASIVAFYKGEFKARGWAYQELTSRPGSTTLQSSKPCATVTITEGAKKGTTNVIVATADRCSTASPSPSPSNK